MNACSAEVEEQLAVGVDFAQSTAASGTAVYEPCHLIEGRSDTRISSRTSWPSLTFIGGPYTVLRRASGVNRFKKTEVIMPRFEVSCQIEYEIAFPSTLILNIYPQRNESQTVVDENLILTPEIKAEEFTIPGTDSRFLRLATGNMKHLSISYTGTVDCEYQFFKAKEIDGTPLSKMDHSAIPYLFPSRYCQSDRLSRLAWDYFGKIENTYEKVMAITDWINKNVEYVSGSTNSETSAYDTVTQRTGVCRDFAHLGIAFCRALNIPARYFSGYAYQLQPPDFHACFEVYIGGKWLIFDATHLAHLNGLVRIGTGRDAADAALASIFGRVTCPFIKVDCQLAPNQKHTPLPIQQLKHQGVSLETGADN